MLLVKNTLLIGSEIYRCAAFGSNHPLSIPRVSTVIDLVRALGLCDTKDYKSAPKAKPELLTQFHTEPYIAALQRAEASQVVSKTDRKDYNFGSLSNPLFPLMFERPATSVGSSLLAAEFVAKGGRAYSLGGGLHHGMAGRANGFCFLNDLVFAINRLRSLGVLRIAYVDLDAHHCDGVEAAFPKDSNLLMISIHEAHRWPFTGQVKDNVPGRILDIPLPSACNDAEFNYAFEYLVPPILDRFAPDALIVQGGGDALHVDPMSRLSLSNDALWRALRLILEHSSRVILPGGGGYNPWSVARLWSGFWAILSGQSVPNELTPMAADILKTLKWNRRRTVPSYFTKTLLDPPTKGNIRIEVKDLVEYLRKRHF